MQDLDEANAPALFFSSIWTLPLQLLLIKATWVPYFSHSNPDLRWKHYQDHWNGGQGYKVQGHWSAGSLGQSYLVKKRAGWTAMPIHLLPGEDGVAPSLMGCLSQLNSWAALLARSFSISPPPQGRVEEGEAGGQSTGRHSRGSACALHVTHPLSLCPPVGRRKHSGEGQNCFFLGPTLSIINRKRANKETRGLPHSLIQMSYFKPN